MKKVLFLILVCIMLISLLTGCGNPNNSNVVSENDATVSPDSSSATSEVVEKVKVTFWDLSTHKAAMEPISAKFNEENPNFEVTVSYFGTDAIKDACKVAASSGTLPNTWMNFGGSFARFYVENECAYDLTQYAQEKDWNDKFTSSALELCTFDGKLTGYPTAFNVIGVYYRKDLFDKYGLQVPTTFEEFENVCATLKSNGVTPITTAGINGWHVMRFVELFVENYAGAQMHDQLNAFQTSWNCDAVVQALTKYQEFSDKGYFIEGFTAINPDDVNIPLFLGEAAMITEGQWLDGVLIQNGQDLENYGSFALPISGTSRLSSFGGMNQYNAKNTVEEIDACTSFLDYYFSDENVAQYSQYYSQPLPYIGAKMPEGQPDVANLIGLSQTNGTFTITDQAFPAEVADGLFNVQDAIANHQMTPQEGAAKIEEAIEAYRNK